MKSKEPEKRLWQFRIKYRSGDAKQLNYHYYNAYSAEQAYDFQQQMCEYKDWHIQTLCIERKCPWSTRWIDETHMIDIQS